MEEYRSSSRSSGGSSIAYGSRSGGSPVHVGNPWIVFIFIISFVLLVVYLTFKSEDMDAGFTGANSYNY